jgi:hypothetical protein
MSVSIPETVAKVVTAGSDHRFDAGEGTGFRRLHQPTYFAKKLFECVGWLRNRTAFELRSLLYWDSSKDQLHTSYGSSFSANVFLRITD